MKEPYRELNFYADQVEIRIEGFRTERLINKAMKEGLDIRDIRMTSPTEAQCRIPSYQLASLKKQAKAMYRITVKSRSGFFFKAAKLIRSPMRIIGAALIIVLVISQSFFVKTIEVSGYRGIPESELRKCLEEAGISKGTYIPGINWNEAEEKIYHDFPQVTWVRLVYDGRKIFLDISEGRMNSEEEEASLMKKDSREEREYYCNIVADYSGYIEKIGSYRGLALAEEGDYVRKGQVLISGYVPIEATVYSEDWPKEYFVRAAGDITMIVPYRVNFNQERYIRNVHDKDKNDDAEIISDKTEKSEKQIKDKAYQQIRQWAKENLPQNAQIVKKDLKFSYKENIIEVGVTLEVRQQIGIEQEILIGQENSDSTGD